MATLNELETFVRYVEFYWKELNGGGTFTRDELILEVKNIEDTLFLENLKRQSLLILDILSREDWEIEKDVLAFLLKYGKNNVKKIIQSIINNT